MDNSNFTYHRLEDCHLPDVKKLFKSVFNKDISIALLKKKYSSSFISIQYLCFIAYNGNEPIAFYGSIPQLFYYKDSLILVGQGCDVMTLESYRNGALNYTLAMKTYNLMREYDIKFVFGFLNKNSFYSTKKQGFEIKGNMQRFHIKTKALPFSYLFLKFGLKKAFNNFVANRFHNYKTSEVKFSQNLEKGHQLYNENFMAYKNSLSPHYCIMLNGCNFLISVDEKMKVGVFNYTSIDDFKEALEKLKKICRSIGVTEILFHVSSDSSMHKALINVASSQNSWLVGYLSFSTVDVNLIDFCLADSDTF